jgi:hypothetical protein
MDITAAESAVCQPSDSNLAYFAAYGNEQFAAGCALKRYGRPGISWDEQRHHRRPSFALLVSAALILSDVGHNQLR